MCAPVESVEHERVLRRRVTYINIGQRRIKHIEIIIEVMSNLSPNNSSVSQENVPVIDLTLDTSESEEPSSTA